MTDDTEKQLRLLKSEIEYHRKKANQLRKRADAQDRIADDKVKIASELGTGELPLLSKLGLKSVVNDIGEAKAIWDKQNLQKIVDKHHTSP